MPLTAIPRFFPCRRKSVRPDLHAEYIHVELRGGRRALLMHSTRQAAERFVERGGKGLQGWIVGYVGYDVMPLWLVEAAGLHGIDCVVVDKTAADIEPTLVLSFEILMAGLKTSLLDVDFDDEIAVDGELCAI